MLTVAVMPCLNEADVVRDAIGSLLQPIGEDGCETIVIVVDNGSSDGTLDVLADISRSHPGRLRIEAEGERGYVPPRRRGVAVAAQLASEMGVAERDVLVLQADADTVYRSGYATAMSRAASQAEGVILEGSIRRPPAFELEHPLYVEAERTVDAAIEPLEAADEDDVVVDDKVCAYRLSDYMAWGGLFEEWSDAGDAIHAETTRMFVRARLRHGVSKVRVNPAGAFPSRRRVFENARYHFATLGFPRERTWGDRLKRGWSPLGVDAFARAVLDGGEEMAVRLRACHLLALFRFLPAVILDATATDAPLLNEPDVAAALTVIPRRGATILAEQPALAILDVLGLIDTRPDLFGPVAVG